MNLTGETQPLVEQLMMIKRMQVHLIALFHLRTVAVAERTGELLYLMYVLFLNNLLEKLCCSSYKLVFFNGAVCPVQRIPTPLFVLEIWKACFTGLIESPEGTEELKWTAFTFLKVRSISKLAFALRICL